MRLCRLAPPVVLLLAIGPLTPAAAAPAEVDPPQRVVTLTGEGISTWPSYDDAVGRFAIRTTDASIGSVTVTATTTDPDGTVSVDGVPLAGPTTTVDGLETDDEINVRITDSAGTTSQSWIYLPSGFPVLTPTRDDPGQAPGQYLLGLQSFLSTRGFETVVDHRGVPSHVREPLGQDMKRSAVDPDQWSVARSDPAGGDRIDVLDATYATVDSFRLDGIPTATDFHDAQLLPGGGALLMGYHGRSSYVDAVIQVVDADGQATFTWDSKDHLDPADAYVSPGGDYAHVNSLQMLPAGDVIASFRNLSAVLRIATVAHDGYEAGEVVWQLGGAGNDFDLSGDPLGGPCAQHTARLLSDGRLLLFDNGSRYDAAAPFAGQTADMCPDPSDPDGARVARPQSRVVEYDLDEEAMTADVVWSYDVPARYAAFAGSSQRLPGGNTVIGWSNATDTSGGGAPQPIASEVTADGTEVWALRAGGWFSYRVAKHDAPDRLPPVAELTGLTEGATYREGEVLPVTHRCTDTGGSNLASCTGTVGHGAAAPTTPGAHTVAVTAVDGAGNRTVSSVSYDVVPARQPDASLRWSRGAWRGAGTIGGPDAQTIGRTIGRRAGRQVVEVRVRNTGLAGDRLTVAGPAGSRDFAVDYRAGGADVTQQVVGGRFVTSPLAAGASYTLRMRVVRTDRARPDRNRRLVLRVGSRALPARVDRVAVRLRTP